MIVLNAVEARVIGALIEKEITTPEYYPLSLNALVNACNQKSSRDPVMELTEAEVRTALFELEQRSLVRVLAEARVPKFEHRLRDPLTLRRDEIAVVCLLLLRGPQTAAELRARAERLYSFDDTAAVLATLERLAGREEPVVRALGRQAGAREGRWRHLLDGMYDDAVAAPAEETRRRPEGDGLAQRVAELEARVATLEERLARLDGHPSAAESS
jgi:uncharacterized protein YceH (UPF0502 family)